MLVQIEYDGLSSCSSSIVDTGKAWRKFGIHSDGTNLWKYLLSTVNQIKPARIPTESEYEENTRSRLKRCRWGPSRGVACTGYSTALRVLALMELFLLCRAADCTCTHTVYGYRNTVSQSLWLLRQIVYILPACPTVYMGCMYVILFKLFVFVRWIYVSYLVLDPRISYEGMKSDYADDNILTDYLESAKASLPAISRRTMQENISSLCLSLLPALPALPLVLRNLRMGLHKR